MESGFWELPEKIETRSPLAILKEQASALTKATKGDVLGHVGLNTYGNHFNATLYIIAPSLNNYTYSLLEVNYDINMYPATIRMTSTGEQVDASTESTFVEKLKSFIQSTLTRSVVLSLLTQVREMAKS